MLPLFETPINICFNALYHYLTLNHVQLELQMFCSTMPSRCRLKIRICHVHLTTSSATVVLGACSEILTVARRAQLIAATIC